MDTETRPTVDEIAAAFSKTVFWNNGNPWPAEPAEEPYPLEVLDPAPPAYDGFCGDRPILLRFLTGDLSVDVAMLPEQGDDADVGNVTSKADAAFIANLPVYVPVLLGRIAELEQFITDKESAAASS